MGKHQFDIRNILSYPYFYTLFHYMIGDRKMRSVYVQEYIRPEKGNRIIDIGCGPGDILKYLPDVEYLGFDTSQFYIDKAKRRFGGRGSFLCKKITSETIRADICGELEFDIALANGVLHHLDDKEVRSLFDLSYKALRPGGRLLTLDGCYTAKQSRAARFLLSKDRGKYVRTEAEYRALACSSFKTCRSYIRNDLYRIPYTLIILEHEK